MRSLAVFVLFTVIGSSASAEDNQLTGAWSKKAQGFELKMAFQKDNALKFSMEGDNEGCTLTAKYTTDKDGTVKCEVTKFEKKGNFPVEKEVGYKFSFKAEFKGKTAKISHFEGKDIDDQAKDVLEGDYTKTDD